MGKAIPSNGGMLEMSGSWVVLTLVPSSTHTLLPLEWPRLPMILAVPKALVGQCRVEPSPHSVCVSGWIQAKSQESQNWAVLMKPGHKAWTF